MPASVAPAAVAAAVTAASAANLRSASRRSLRSRRSSNANSAARVELQGRKDEERDFKCQFATAAMLGAIGIVLTVVGVGLVAYGIPTPERLERDFGHLAKEELLHVQLRLTLFGRIGGLLVGIGVFLVMVLLVLGLDYKMFLDRQRPADNSLKEANKRLYADFMKDLRRARDDEETGSQSTSFRSGTSANRRPSTSLLVTTSRPSTASGLTRRSSLVGGTNASRRGSLPVPELSASGAASPGYRLSPKWRVNPAFDFSEEAVQTLAANGSSSGEQQQQKQQQKEQLQQKKQHQSDAQTSVASQDELITAGRSTASPKPPFVMDGIPENVKEEDGNKATAKPHRVDEKQQQQKQQMGNNPDSSNAIAAETAAESAQQASKSEPVPVEAAKKEAAKPAAAKEAESSPQIGGVQDSRPGTATVQQKQQQLVKRPQTAARRPGTGTAAAAVAARKQSVGGASATRPTTAAAASKKPAPAARPTTAARKPNAVAPATGGAAAAADARGAARPATATKKPVPSTGRPTTSGAAKKRPPTAKSDPQPPAGKEQQQQQQQQQPPEAAASAEAAARPQTAIARDYTMVFDSDSNSDSSSEQGESISLNNLNRSEGEKQLKNKMCREDTLDENSSQSGRNIVDEMTEEIYRNIDLDTFPASGGSEAPAAQPNESVHVQVHLHVHVNKGSNSSSPTASQKPKSSVKMLEFETDGAL